MTEKTIRPDSAQAQDSFHALHRNLTVDLIMTPRCDFESCTLDQPVRDVMKKNSRRRYPFDYFPVFAPEDEKKERILGLFPAVECRGREWGDERIGRHCVPLCEGDMIGTDTSILAFVREADRTPFRLVVSRSGIAGLVSISDLHKLPVRAALFALITGLELTMYEMIRRKYRDDADGWKRLLSCCRRKAVEARAEESRKSGVDDLLFTEFCDKREVFVKDFHVPQSKTNFRKRMDPVEGLRDDLAHANKYALKPEEARDVCKTVRDLLELREEMIGLNSDFAPTASALGDA